MNAKGLMAIPKPHMLILERLQSQLAVDRFGLIGWLGAIPEALRGMDAQLLFLPLLQRAMVVNGSEIMGDRAGEHFCRITPLGQRCLAYGFMPVAAVPVTDEHVALMELAPPPQELAESVDGGLVLVQELPVEGGGE